MDLRFNDLGNAKQQGKVREMRKGAREVMEARRGREDAGTRQNVSWTAMFSAVLRGGVWMAWWLQDDVEWGKRTGRGSGLYRGGSEGKINAC